MQKKILLIGSIVVSALTAGCSSFMHADLPDVSAPLKFNSATSNQQIESLPYLAWWHQFNDPQLNNLIESGLNNNLDINVALSNLEQARGQLTQIQLSWIPFVNLYGGYSSNPAFGDIGTFYGAWPQYIINIAGVIQAQRQAKYNLQMRSAMVDGVRLTVIGQISASYFSLIAQERQLELLNIFHDDLQQLLDLSMQEVKIGLRNNIDTDGVRSQLNLIQAQIEVVKHNIVLSNNAISYLLNHNPGSVANSNNFTQLDFAKFKPGDLPANVLQNRPDIKIAEYQLQLSNAGVGVAYSNLFPELQLDSFFGYGSREGRVASPNYYAPMQDAYVNWGINPSTFGQIEAAKGAYQAQVYNYIQSVRKALRDTDNSLSANNQYGKNYLKINQALNNLQDKYKLQSGLYKTGIMSYPELLRNKIEVDNLAITDNQAKLSQALSLVNLYQELAGGYKYESSVTNK